jgi:hypothetical protein
MAKGQHYSAYQQKVIRRFYEHADIRTVTALQEAVTELYLAPEGNARKKLWTKVEGLLAKTGANKARIAQIMQTRDVKLLAQMVGEIAGKA